MEKRDEDPEQSKQWGESGKPSQPNLLPIEEVLAQQGYSSQVIENYSRITQKRLATSRVISHRVQRLASGT
jgi:hypothetical protein